MNNVNPYFYLSDANSEQLNLFSDKRIKVYKDFIITNNFIHELIKKNFKRYSYTHDISYIYKGGDIIIINEQCQNNSFFSYLYIYFINFNTDLLTKIKNDYYCNDIKKKFDDYYKRKQLSHSLSLSSLINKDGLNNSIGIQFQKKN